MEKQAIQNSRIINGLLIAAVALPFSILAKRCSSRFLRAVHRHCSVPHLPLARKRGTRSLAITAGLLLVLLLFAGLVSLLSDPVQRVLQDLPELKAKLQPAISNLQHWLENNFNISIASQKRWWADESRSAIGQSPGLITGIFSQTASGLFTLLSSPVFAALFLL